MSGNKTYERGLVIGKFYPPHKGHKFLIDTAQSQCEHLDIICCANKNQTIDGKLRKEWLQEIHPRARVFLVDDEGIPENDSPLWARLTVQWLGYAPDAVFTSEAYGKPWAEALGCAHVDVDFSRQNIPCSGTQIRGNPLANLQFLEPCVANYFVEESARIPRIVVLGAESTGTTTLSLALAGHYNAPWVPEYGRLYTLEKLEAGTLDTPWTAPEFMHIAKEQERLEDEAAGQAVANKRPLVIADTDAFATTLWEERYVGSISSGLAVFAAAGVPLLYILTPPDIPFVQDGIRDGEHIRHHMHERFLEELEGRHLPYIVTPGEVPERLSLAVAAIDRALAQLRERVAA